MPRKLPRLWTWLAFSAICVLTACSSYALEHGSGTPDMAQVYVADDQYFYVFTYFGDIPDNPANRATYLRLLETVSLADSTTQGLLLPETSFTEGITLGSTQASTPQSPSPVATPFKRPSSIPAQTSSPRRQAGPATEKYSEEGEPFAPVRCL